MCHFSLLAAMDVNHRPPLYCVAAVVILSLPDSRFFNFSLSWLSVHTLHPLVVDSGEGVDVAYVCGDDLNASP